MTQLPLIDDQEVEMPRNSEGLPFSGPRLIMARHRRGHTPAELAHMIHVPRATLIGFETETIAPTIEQIGNMSMMLHFPIGFFFAEGQRLINPESVSWRSGGSWVWDADNQHERKWIDQQGEESQ